VPFVDCGFSRHPFFNLVPAVHRLDRLEHHSLDLVSLCLVYITSKSRSFSLVCFLCLLLYRKSVHCHLLAFAFVSWFSWLTSCLVVTSPPHSSDTERRRTYCLRTRRIRQLHQQKRMETRTDNVLHTELEATLKTTADDMTEAKPANVQSKQAHPKSTLKRRSPAPPKLLKGKNETGHIKLTASIPGKQQALTSRWTPGSNTCSCLFSEKTALLVSPPSRFLFPISSFSSTVYNCNNSHPSMYLCVF